MINTAFTVTELHLLTDLVFAAVEHQYTAAFIARDIYKKNIKHQLTKAIKVIEDKKRISKYLVENGFWPHTKYFNASNSQLKKLLYTE